MKKTANINKTQMGLRAAWSVLNLVTMGHPISALIITGGGLVWITLLGKIIGGVS